MIKKKVAITGSSGFIGTHLTSFLFKKDLEIFEISRTKGFDITSWQSVKDIEPCDIIIHLAAKTFVPDSFKNPKEFYQVNFLATLNMLELARKWNARVIYIGSYIYGPPKYLPVDEKHSIHPHNPYAESKMLSESLCKAYYRDFSIPCINFRLFNIYGPDQDTSFLIPSIIKEIKNGINVELKDPRPKRDYIYISDVVKAIYLAIKNDLEKYKVLNLGTGTSTSVSEIVEIIQNNTQKKIFVNYTHEYRKNEVLDCVADITKLREELGFEPSVSVEEGIKLLIK